MPRRKYISRVALERRGWTEALIGKVLGAEDEEVTYQFFQSAEPMQLYLRDRVVEAERQVDVRKAIQAQRDTWFGITRCCQKPKRGFSVYARFDCTGRVEVRLTGDAGTATVVLSDPEFVQLVQSACEQQVADAVLKWLVEHGAGDESFRTVLNNCVTGQASRMYAEQQRQQEEGQRRRQEEMERRRQERAFQHEHRVGEFVLTFVHNGEEPVLLIDVHCDSGGSTGACVRDPACIDLARACTTPEAVPQFLASLLERYYVNPRFRLAADCIMRGDAQDWREKNEGLKQRIY